MQSPKYFLSVRMENNMALQLAHSTGKEYVREEYPEYETRFEEIWNYSISSLAKKKTYPKPKIAAVKFAGDETFVLIAQVVIPFLTGLFSSVLTGAIIEKMKTDLNKAKIELNAEGEIIRIDMNLDKKTARKLVEKAYVQLEKTLPETKKSPRRVKST